MDVEVHPAAGLFPLLGDDEFASLVLDIKENGLREPIVFTPDGLLLDGRNRWRACAAAGVTPTSRVEHGEPWAFVISANVHRRHLSDGQRAMIADKVADCRGVGRPKTHPTAGPPRLTINQTAALLNIKNRAVDQARIIRKAGTPELQALAEDGLVPLYTASRITELDPDRQNEFVRQVRGGTEPMKLATRMGAPSPQWKPPRTEASPRRNGSTTNRHQHLDLPALIGLQNSLEALDMVLNTTDGLDPAITSEQATQMLGGLSKGRGALRRIRHLLTERMESTNDQRADC